MSKLHNSLLLFDVYKSPLLNLSKVYPYMGNSDTDDNSVIYIGGGSFQKNTRTLFKIVLKPTLKWIRKHLSYLLEGILN